MKILAICTVYNELDYIPLKAAWCRANGLELYVIDNMSTDGTWEWLQKNGIASHRFDTAGEFHLVKLQEEMTKTIHRIKPDWVIYHGADLFFSTFMPLNKMIAIYDEKGFNRLAMQYAQVCFTGEERVVPFNPFSNFVYGSQGKVYSFIGKYHPELKLQGDGLNFPDISEVQIVGVIANYGHTKERERREETVKRREKAWANGLAANLGRHYKRAPETWQWAKEMLTDLRKSSAWKYILRIEKDCGCSAAK
jgi:glycosyltransferase involved in cell wall biosynthesis